MPKNSYIRQIQRCYPDIEVQSVQFNAIGRYNDVLIVNNHLIVRFPKFQDGIKQLAVETAILLCIQGKVSLKTPKPIYRNIETTIVGEAFVGYEMIKGEPLWRETVSSITDEAVLQQLTVQLATFLKDLHSISVDKSISLPLPHVDTRQEWLDLYERIRVKLFEFMRPDAQLAVTTILRPIWIRQKMSHLNRPCDMVILEQPIYCMMKLCNPSQV